MEKKRKRNKKKTFLRNIDEDNFLLGISLNSLYIFFVVSKPQQQKSKKQTKWERKQLYTKIKFTTRKTNTHVY